MAFNIKLYNNTSPVEKIGKDLTGELIISDVVLKRDTSILRPVLLVSAESSVYLYNYMYIEEFGRYYFIDDIRSVNNNIWEISAHVDVLETYKEAILSNSAIIENTERNGANMYLYDPEIMKVNCKHKTDIINFPEGLLDTGEFILITAGG